MYSGVCISMVGYKGGRHLMINLHFLPSLQERPSKRFHINSKKKTPAFPYQNSQIPTPFLIPVSLWAKHLSLFIPILSLFTVRSFHDEFDIQK